MGQDRYDGPWLRAIPQLQVSVGRDAGEHVGPSLCKLCGVHQLRVVRIRLQRRHEAWIPQPDRAVPAAAQESRPLRRMTPIHAAHFFRVLAIAKRWLIIAGINRLIRIGCP